MMKPREIALRLLDEYEASGKYINLSLSSHLLDRLGGEERGFVTALLYTAVERKITLDYLVCSLSGRGLDRIDPHTLNILRLGLVQILYLDTIPDYAAVMETVSLARGGERGFVNALLRSASRAKAENKLPMPDRGRNEARYLGIKYSFPLPLVKRFVSIFGLHSTEELLRFFNERSYTDLTVNLRRGTREELIELLGNGGITARPSALSPLSVRIKGSVNPTRLPGFAEGRFFVQDTASALVASVLSAGVGDRVVDVCACPGGKSFGAAMTAGEVYSFDIHESKLSLISSGAQRLGLDNIKPAVRDAREPDPSLIGRVDKVICDVPCSGLGVLGKKADMRYRRAEDIDALPELGGEILRASFEYLRPGGELVYSTCTLNPDENDRVVEEFLKSCPEAEALPVTVGGAVYNTFTAFPPRDDTDGFFIAKIRRKV